LHDHEFLVSCPPLPEEGPIQADPAPASSEAPEADGSQDRDDAKESHEERGYTSSPPPTNSKEKSPEKKRKCLDDLASSSTSLPNNAAEEPAAAKTSDLEMFEFLNS
jgi:hypothetical protein